jgi:hypothetical protein
MKENVGRKDQLVRSIVGPALMLLGYHAWGGKRGRAAGLLAMLAGTLISETALTRTCPLNEVFGVDTRECPLISGPPVRAPEEYTNPKQVYG